MNIETFIRKAKQLRAHADEAERNFLLFLVSGEADRDMWQSSGSITFDSFLKSTGLCEPSRYRNFRAANEVAPKLVASVGAHAAVQAGSFKTPRAVREVLEQSKIWEATNGVTISEQSAEKIAGEVRTRIATHSTGNRSYAVLVADLERVSLERNRLIEENKNLRAEIAALKAQNRKARAA
jgi:hypothetical protein